MKYMIIILIILLVFSSYSFPQSNITSSKSTLIAGTASFNSNGGELFESLSGNRLTTLSLALNFKFFIVQNLSLGLGTVHTRQSQGYASYSTTAVGPSISYFVEWHKDKLFPYLSAGVLFHTISSGKSSMAGKDIVFGVGMLTLLKNHLGFMLEASYHFIDLHKRGVKESTTGDSIMIGIGFAAVIY